MTALAPRLATRRRTRVLEKIHTISKPVPPSSLEPTSGTVSPAVSGAISRSRSCRRLRWKATHSWWRASPAQLQSSAERSPALWGLRIGDTAASVGTGERRKAGKLLPPSFRYSGPQVGAQIAEEQKRLTGSPFLPHEEQRQRRGQKQHGRGRPDRLRRGQGRDALTEGPVTNLIVILEEPDEGRRRQVPARFAARPTLEP